jgi:adenine/guanine/hypoxanthine permease
MSIEDLLAALGVIVNGLPQGLLALTFGFASVPTAAGFIAGAIGCGVFGVVAPISFQAETITLVGTMGRTIRERLSMVFWEGTILLIIGLLGVFTKIVNFIGPVITNAMMAGVGIILAKVAIDMTRRNPLIGGISIASAVLTYYITPNPANKLVFTIVVSVLVATIAAVLRKQKIDFCCDETREKFIFQKPIINMNVIRGTLGIVTLNIGANIAFGSITAKTIAKSDIDLDHLTIISSVADMASSLFGGGPVQAIISATGAAPHPLLAGVLMMAIMAVILLAKLLPKIGKYVPNESIAGFLLVLGAIVTVPINASLALQSGVGTPDTIIGGVTMVVTAITDPFVGMVAGLVVKMMISIFA